MTSYIELKKIASDLGINSFGVRRDKLEQMVKEKMGELPVLADNETLEAEVADAPQQETTNVRAEMEQARAPREATGRATRIAVGGKKLKLEVKEKDPGFRYRFVKDDKAGRIEEFQQAGYEVVKKADGTPDKRLVGVDQHGQPRYDFLMKQKEEYYQEDQRAKEAEIKARERASIEDPTQGQHAAAGLYDIGSSIQ